MQVYTVEKIEALISCPKVVTDPPKKELKLENGHFRNNLELKSEDGELNFTVFIRINFDFPENFSIGLEYWPKEERGSICLLRCNGPHGEFVSSFDLPMTHFVHHIHKAKPENIEAGLRAEKGGEPTNGYGSYDQALSYFCQVINLKNVDQYFPRKVQMPLDFASEGGTT